ncbi:protein-tyrosine-phosphatase [Actinoplanes sp. NBRC 14428]|nr:protein-tyrosine-phosphatase [Actinoplanes sp. NBRC 14428]
MTADRFAVLIVCHANLCRSPMAEYLLRHALESRLGPAAGGLEILSAGTDAWADLPMHPLSVEALGEHGLDGTAFRSRRLTPALVKRAGLVLTATRRQRSVAVAMEPAAVKHAFTLPQFARLAAEVAVAAPLEPGTPAQRLGRIIERIPMVRGHLPVPPAEQDEIADPVRMPIEVFRRCAHELDRIAGVTAQLIAPSR